MRPATLELRERGGTLVLASEDRWIGPGHASIHERDGRPRLRLVPLTWDAESWLIVLAEK